MIAPPWRGARHVPNEPLPLLRASLTRARVVPMSKESERHYIGGQAVIEGVMMRSPGSMSIVCRRRSGELIVREQPMIGKPKGWRTLPFLRGVATVVDSLRLGSRALRWSAELYEQDIREEEEAASKGPPSKPPTPA